MKLDRELAHVPSTSNPRPEAPATLPATLDEVHRLFRESAAHETGLTLLEGFKLNFSGNQEFHKVFFSIRCGCGTAAVLSVEAAKSKTLPQIREVLPGLIEHLKVKAKQFRNMSCEMHGLMRTGGQR